jgi:hypothetical protein
MVNIAFNTNFKQRGFRLIKMKKEYDLAVEVAKIAYEIGRLANTKPEHLSKDDFRLAHETIEKYNKLPQEVIQKIYETNSADIFILKTLANKYKKENCIERILKE